MFGLHVYLYATRTPGMHEGQKLGPNPLELELQKLGAACGCWKRNLGPLWDQSTSALQQVMHFQQILVNSPWPVRTEDSVLHTQDSYNPAEEAASQWPVRTAVRDNTSGQSTGQ